MIKVADCIWIGNSADEARADLSKPESVGAILNVARDLECTRGCSSNIDYNQVGLLDGPGNPLSSYVAAVMTLASLIRRDHRVLICCHTGMRSLAVVLMYLSMMTGRSWDDLLNLIRERVDHPISPPHPAHAAAHAKIDWKMVGKIAEAGE